MTLVLLRDEATAGVSGRLEVRGRHFKQVAAEIERERVGSAPKDAGVVAVVRLKVHNLDSLFRKPPSRPVREPGKACVPQQRTNALPDTPAYHAAIHVSPVGPTLRSAAKLHSGQALSAAS